jgi:hypothetical protein
MAANRFYSNLAVATTLTGSISSGATSIPVAASTGFPGSFPYTLALDFGGSAEELVNVTSAAGLTLTAARGYGGTSAQSHSIGAVVKHVYNAVDAGDFRTHEGASAAVHGVAGTLVGTNDVQTLGNKTLTSPAINSAALSGTFTGGPLFSGAPTFSGAVSHTSTLSSVQSAAANQAYGASVSGDTFDRFRVRGDGQIELGSGAGARDTILLREAANTLATTDTLLRVYRAGAASAALSLRVAGDTTSRLTVGADGAMAWGPGGAGATDTNLYRGAANQLETDDSFVVGGNLSVVGDVSGSGIGSVKRARKTADTSVASNVTPATDPHLSIAVVASAIYEVEGVLFFTSTAAGSTPAVKVAINAPASATGFWSAVGPASASTADPDTVRTVATAIGTANRTFGISLITSGTNPAIGFHIKGMAEIAGTAGNITVDWSQANSSATATVLKQYSWLRLTRVA